MYKDEIIAKVWANREAYVATHFHDLGAMIRDLKRRQKASGRLLVDRRPKLNKITKSDRPTLAAD